jgi:hypothetical protein
MEEEIWQQVFSRLSVTDSLVDGNTPIETLACGHVRWRDYRIWQAAERRSHEHLSRPATSRVAVERDIAITGFDAIYEMEQWRVLG